jgi:hypothetical protein
MSTGFRCAVSGPSVAPRNTIIHLWWGVVGGRTDATRFRVTDTKETDVPRSLNRVFAAPFLRIRNPGQAIDSSARNSNAQQPLIKHSDLLKSEKRCQKSNLTAVFTRVNAHKYCVNAAYVGMTPFCLFVMIGRKSLSVIGFCGKLAPSPSNILRPQAGRIS